MAMAASSGITLGIPAVNGTGCQPSDVSSSITEDGKTLSILFSNYVARAGKFTMDNGATANKPFDRKT